MKKYILLTVISAALILMVSAGCMKKETPAAPDAPAGDQQPEKPDSPDDKEPGKEAEKPEPENAPKPSGDVIEVESKDGLTEILASNKIVLADFNADWCPPCKRLKPIIKEIAKEYAGKAAVVSINVDKLQDLAAEYRISGIPDVRIFKDKQQVKKLVGLRSKSHYTDAIDELVK